jgi:hypothetical protein
MLYIRTLHAATFVLLIGAAPAAAGQMLTVCAESFDYPAPSNLGGLTGGSGWNNAWDSGPNGDNAVIATPGHDATGNKATVNINWATSFREPSSSGFEYLLDGGQFGADGFTLWTSFLSVRAVTVGGGYGGLSFFDSAGAERLFMGSPWLSDEWGVHPYPNGVPQSVPGSNVDVLTQLVYRIDFQPGDERLRLWLDPATSHPSGPADMDLAIPDLRFTRIRIASGGSAGAELYDFDDMRIETPPLTLGAPYCFGDGSLTSCPCGNPGAAGEGCANSTGSGATLAAGGSASVSADDLLFDAAGLVPFQPALLFSGLNAVNGGAGVVFGDGLRCAGGSVKRLGVQNAGSTGGATWGPGLAPIGGWVAGDTRRFQAWYRDPVAGPCGSTFNLSHGVEVIFLP